MYSGLDTACAYVEAEIRLLPGPVDALVGFSQGANLISVISARASLGLAGAMPPLRCVVLLSGSLPGFANDHAHRVAPHSLAPLGPL